MIAARRPRWAAAPARSPSTSPPSRRQGQGEDLAPLAPQRTVLGKSKFKVSAGKKKKIRVRLSRRGRRKVLRKRRIRCRVSVANKGQDGKLVTTKQTVLAEGAQGEGAQAEGRQVTAGVQSPAGAGPRRPSSPPWRAWAPTPPRRPSPSAAPPRTASSRPGSTPGCCWWPPRCASPAVCSSRSERAAWLILGAGILAWAGGEIYWNVASPTSPSRRSPTCADLLWFAFFPCCYVAMVLLVRARVREFRASLWLDGIVGALAIAAVGTALVFGALSAGGGAEVTLDLAYLLADLLLLGLRDLGLRPHRLAARRPPGPCSARAWRPPPWWTASSCTWTPPAAA